MTVPYASDLWCDYDGSQIGLADGATVTSIPDRSGNGHDATIVGTTTTCHANALNGLSVFNQFGGLIQTPAVDTALHNGFSFFCVWKITQAGDEPMWDQTSTVWMKDFTSSPQGWSVDGIALQASSTNQSAYPWHLATWTGGADGLALYTGSPYRRRSGIDQSDAANFAIEVKGPTTGNHIQVPRGGFQEVAEVLIYKRHLTFAEECEVAAYLAGKWGLWSPVTQAGGYLLLHAGNSTTANAVFGRFNARSLAALKPLEYSEAVSGSNSSDWLARTPEGLAAVQYAVTKGLTPILVAHTGHNDGAVSEVSSVVTNASGPVQALRTAGARALLVTMSAWNNSPSLDVPRSDKETFRPSLNAWILANWSAYADAVYDLGATPQFGIYTADGSTPANASVLQYPTYWNDNVHHTEAGQAAKAALLQDVQLALAGNASVTSNTPGAIALTHSHVPTGWSKQWYRSTTAGSRGSALSGATTVPYTDTTAVAGTTYYYSLKLSSTTPVTAAAFSPQVSALAAGGASHNLSLLGVGS